MTPPLGWQLGRLLAIGGSALVYELSGAQPAVLKWARWRDRDIRARFEIEADVLRTIGAPTTPQLVDSGTVDGWPYLVLERMIGETLAAWMSRTGERGGLGEILAILTRIAQALGAVHDAGYVHRDLKPENITIGARGARLLDFGLAKPLRGSSELTQIGTVVGTSHYIAPEQIRMSNAIDHRADIYSFGVIAFEMLTGLPPFVGERRAIEYQHHVVRPPSVRDTRAVPAELDHLVLACLAKQPDARPASCAELRARIGDALQSMGTLRGVGNVSSAQIERPIGTQSEAVLAWIVGGDLVAVARAIANVNGIVAKQRGDGVLAVFSAQQHEAPLAIALGTCRELARERCRVTLHASAALVRRTAQGKLMAYGRDIERVDWIPDLPVAGLVLTAAAASRAKGMVAAPDAPGFFREPDAVHTDTTEHEQLAALVGRRGVVEQVAEDLARPVLINVSGGEGIGKSRLLDAIADKLRAQHRDVIHVRARRRFDGDRADDDRLLHALGGDHDPQAVLAAAGKRGAVVIVDDVDRLSARMRGALLQRGVCSRVLASEVPLFEVMAGDDARIAIRLPALSNSDAMTLLRSQLRPARLIPEVLLERLALRGMGNPRMLIALALDLKRRGAIRRHAGSDELYVAVDELDTLLAPPGPEWASRSVLDELPHDVAQTLLACSALGPRMCTEETAYVVGDSAARDLEYLVHRRLLVERNGWFEFENPRLQDAMYSHYDQRTSAHTRALAYWLSHRSANVVGGLARIAHHAANSGEVATAVASWLALAQLAEATDREHADTLHARAQALLARSLPPLVREMIESLQQAEATLSRGRHSSDAMRPLPGS